MEALSSSSSLTGGDPGGFSEVPSFDAGDQFALVLHGVPPDQGGFPLPAFRKTESRAEGGKRRKPRSAAD